MHRRFRSYNPMKERLKTIALWLGAFLFSFFLLGIMTVTAIFIAFSRDLPSAEQLKNISFHQSTVILDRTGKLLYTIHGEENREIVLLKDISPYLVKATLAVEDQHFYEHRGFYPKRILGAFYYKIIGFLTGTEMKLAGASTITQQFAKNAFLTSERTLSRKIKELILAFRLEQAYTKDQILEMYLNKIPYGNNGYGIERASQIYFNKHAKDLTLAESAILAGLPQAPSRYNPHGQHRYSTLIKEFTDEELLKRNIAKEQDLYQHEFSRGLIGKVNVINDKAQVYIRGRSDVVLRIMSELNLINKDEKQSAWAETQKIEFYKHRELIKAPHFVLYVKSLLEERYGKDVVEKGGLRVYTTLDLEIQEMAEKAIVNKTEFNLKQYGNNNQALLAVQPRTGQILAMVGSSDYYNDDIDGNVNMVTRPRQPGSSFKPVLYSLAFLKKYSPANVVYDLETKFDGGKPPKNFDGRFEGPITLRRALGQSRNIPAIKLYFLDGGQKEIIPYARKLGITSLDPNFDYNWPLALGSGEITLLELTQTYAVFANNGTKKDITPILKIVDSRGRVLEEWKDNLNKEEVINPQVAFLINDILSDKSVGLGPKLEIEGYKTAAKTGTSTKRLSEDKVLPTNLLMFHYTPKIVVSVWAGNTDGSATKINGDGYNTAAPIAKDFMIELFSKRSEFSSEDFQKPDGIERITVSKASGKLPGPLNPPDMLISDYFASFAKPTEVDDSFETALVDTMTNKLATQYCPPEVVEKKLFKKHRDIDITYERWQAAVDSWALANPEWSNALPKEKDTLHNENTLSQAPTIKILEPLPNDIVSRGFVDVRVMAPAPNGVDKVEYYLNDRLQYTAKDPPYHGSVRIARTAKSGSSVKIRVTVYDTLFYRSSTEMTVFIEEKETTDTEERIIDAIEEITSEESISE